MTNKDPAEPMSRFYWIDPAASAIGVKFQVAEIHNVRPTKESEKLEEIKRNVVSGIGQVDYSDNTILSGYRSLFDSVGALDAVASPELLLQFVKRSGRLPKVNTVVDAYNVVSLQTLVVVSAHDLDRTEGSPRIAITSGAELFYPLGSNGESISLPAGQWAGIVDNHVLCQMNCKQSELSKVTATTKNLLVYVQGNRAISEDALGAALRAVCESIVAFNGGVIVPLKSRL